MNGLNLIGGEWCEAAGMERMPVLDPADDAPIGSVPSSGPADVIRAIDGAEQSLPHMVELGLLSRMDIVREISRGIQSRRDEIAALITREQGKPISESQAEIDYAISFFDQSIQDAHCCDSEHISVTGKAVEVHMRPVGITALILAWNFPLALLAKKAAPAIIAGCPLLIKPSECTPLTTLLFGEIALGAGVPPQALSILTGPPEPIGEAILGDHRVRKVSFTGSTEVGRILIRQSALHVSRLSLELGGHAPFIVCSDADVDSAVEIAIAAKFRNGGQTCIAPNRFIIHEELHDSFVTTLSERISSLRSGRGQNTDVDLGPMISESAVVKVERHCQDMLERGGALVCGGGRRAIPGLVDRFFEPTIITGLHREMLAWNEESFGPLCPVASFTSIDHAISMANDTPYGLAAYACTNDQAIADRLGHEIASGVIGINDPGPAIAAVPMGGIGYSGYGREGGKWAFEPYLAAVTVSRR